MMNRHINAVGLDIGTSRVRCVIGEPAENGMMNIVGIGEAESRGLRRGIVSTTDAVAESVKRAVEDAEKVSGLEVQMATVNLSGEHLQGENKGGVVAVAGAGREISEDDVERAIESASAMPLPAGWEIIDRLPQEFIVDGQDGITEPIGMRGARLESRVHVIISPSAGKQNIEKAVNRAGFDVDGMVLEPVAAAAATLTDDDKEYGCALINIGSELTSLMIFGRGAVQHTRVFPFGGMHFTKDIALGLRVSIPEANAIKRDYGCVAPFLFRENEGQEIIEINPVGRSETRGLSKEILCDIMSPRAIELLQHLALEINRTGAQNSSGVVLTGGGSQVRGMVEIAEQVFDAPTRLGFVNRDLFGGLAAEVQKPEWATACGLALTSMRRQIREQMAGPTTATQKMAAWFENFRGKFK